MARRPAARPGADDGERGAGRPRPAARLAGGHRRTSRPPLQPGPPDRLADHLSGGRSGLVPGLADGNAAGGQDDDGAWGGARLTPGVPVDAGTALDAAVALRKLWHSWPYESVIADRAARIYARADQIGRVRH